MRAVASSRAKLLLETLDYYFRYFHHWYWFCYSEDDFCQLYLLLLFSYCFITIIHFMIATTTTTAVILFILISFPSYVDNVTLCLGKSKGFLVVWINLKIPFPFTLFSSGVRLTVLNCMTL